MRPALVLLCFLLAGWPSPADAADRVVAFVGGTVIDGTGGAPRPKATVLVEADRIVSVSPAAETRIPEGAEVVDATGLWIIPGLIDAHVHVFQSGGLYARPDVIDLRAIRPHAEEIAQVRAKLAETLARYIVSGVTGAVDLGGPMWTFEARALARDTRVAPRLAVTGPLLATLAPAQLTSIDDPPMLRIDTPEKARAAVERLRPHRRTWSRSGSSCRRPASRGRWPGFAQRSKPAMRRACGSWRTPPRPGLLVQ